MEVYLQALDAKRAYYTLWTTRLAHYIHRQTQQQEYNRILNDTRGTSNLGTSRTRKSPLREVVRSSAGAGVVYPPFWGSFA